MLIKCLLGEVKKERKWDLLLWFLTTHFGISMVLCVKYGFMCHVGIVDFGIWILDKIANPKPNKLVMLDSYGLGYDAPKCL